MIRFRNNWSQVKIREKIIKLSSFIVRRYLFDITTSMFSLNKKLWRILNWRIVTWGELLLYKYRIIVNWLNTMCDRNVVGIVCRICCRLASVFLSLFSISLKFARVRRQIHATNKTKNLSLSIYVKNSFLFRVQCTVILYVWSHTYIWLLFLK